MNAQATVDSYERILLLEIYQVREGANRDADTYWPEEDATRKRDDGDPVEVIATRKVDKKTIAIEQTIVQPCLGERETLLRLRHPAKSKKT